MNFDAIRSVQTDQAERLDRRSVLRMAAGLGAAVAGGALANRVAVQQASAAAGYYRTTTALNLRTGPSTNRRVILVLPQNARVQDLGGNKNGFRQVSFRGTDGWASLSYLVVDNGEDPDPVISGTAVTTTAVNLRSGPSTGHSVLRVLAKGTQVETSLTVQSGFRYVVQDGLAGWVYDDFLAIEGDSPPEGTLVTTTALNLRAEPSLSARVLTVMPSGARVTPTGKGSGQFAQVVYGSLTGWAATAYLN